MLPGQIHEWLEAWDSANRESLPEDLARALSIDVMLDKRFRTDELAARAVAGREAAERAFEELRRRIARSDRSDDVHVQDVCDAIRAASHELKRQCDLGQVRVKGWPGPVPTGGGANKNVDDIAPRQFRHSTLLWFGLIPYTATHNLYVDDPLPCEASYSGLVFHGPDLQRIWPRSGAPPSAAAAAAGVADALPRSGKGGRPPRHDWLSFTREVVRIVALDSGHITRTELKRQMKAWTALNMEPVPDDRTVERKVDDLVGSGVLPD